MNRKNNSKKSFENTHISSTIEDDFFFNANTRKRILKQLSVSKTEQKSISYLVSKFIRKLKTVSDKINPYSVEFKLGGSYAKNTFLKNDFDVDIFCIFQEPVDDEEKFSYIDAILKQCDIKYFVEYGSRKYFSGTFNNESNNVVKKINFECVPTQQFDNPYRAQNSTDLSIYHVEFIKQEVSKNPLLCDEIRLAKQWFKAHELYGAESYINGFSGHGIECLVIQLQSFTHLISYLSNMHKGDIFTFTDSSHEYLEQLSKDKYSPILLQDPIIKNRNALSALGEEIFYRAKFEAIKALNSSICDKDFQIKTSSTQKELFNSIFTNSKETYLGIEINIKKNSKSKDVIGSKCRKIIDKVAQDIGRKGFIIEHTHFTYSHYFNVAYGKVVLQSDNLSSMYYQKGPSLDINIKSIQHFLSKYNNKQLLVKKNHIYVMKQRDFNTIQNYILSYSSTPKILDLIAMKDTKKITSIRLFQ